MQRLSDEMLIKSLSLNIFYPREISPLLAELSHSLGSQTGAAVLFSKRLDNENLCYFSSDLDELGYLRRYSAQRLFFYAKELTPRIVLEASIYGADGLIFVHASKRACQIALGANLHLAQDLQNHKFASLAALKSPAQIIISKEKLSEKRLRGEFV